MLGAAATSIELAISDTVPLATVLPAMLGVHALIGLGEAAITVAAVAAVLALRPDLVAFGSWEPTSRVPVAPKPGSTATARGAS
jgi:cobalt/nickel transport system permease protein